MRIYLRLTVSGLLLLATLLFPELSCAQLVPIDQSFGKAALRLFGDVKTVLDGQCTGTKFREVEPTDYLVALGCASAHEDPVFQGETFFLGGTAFVKGVDPEKGYATERAGSKCWASFLAGLTSDSLPKARYQIQTTEPLALDALYKSLHKSHGSLFGITGRVHFQRLELSAVKKAPIYNEPILGEKRQEYFHPTEVVSDADAFFFGLSLRSNAEANDSTRRVFYINPADKLSTAGQSHTHCAILKANTPLSSQPVPNADSVDSVAHVLTQSSLVSGKIAVYEITDSPSRN